MPVLAALVSLAWAVSAQSQGQRHRRRDVRGAPHRMGRSRSAGPVEQPDVHAARAAPDGSAGAEGHADGRRGREPRSEAPRRWRWSARRRRPRHVQLVLVRSREGREPDVAHPRSAGWARAGLHAIGRTAPRGRTRRARHGAGPADSYGDLPAWTRCITRGWNGIGSNYSSNTQVFQSPGYVASCRN